MLFSSTLLIFNIESGFHCGLQGLSAGVLGLDKSS